MSTGTVARWETEVCVSRNHTWNRIFWLKLHLWKLVLPFTIETYVLLSYRFAFWGNSPGDQKLFISQKSFIITISHSISISKWKPLLKNPIFLHFPVYIIYKCSNLYIHHKYPNKFEGYKFNRNHQTRIYIKFQYLRPYKYN